MNDDTITLQVDDTAFEVRHAIDCDHESGELVHPSHYYCTHVEINGRWWLIEDALSTYLIRSLNAALVRQIEDEHRDAMMYA